MANDYGGLDPESRSPLQMIEQEEQEDLDGGIDWDAEDEPDAGIDDGDAA